jgi:hypothetical protein
MEVTKGLEGGAPKNQTDCQRRKQNRRPVERLWEGIRFRRRPLKKNEALVMADTEINFDAPAMLRKWPSVKKERVTTSLYIRPYLVVEGTLDECMREFMSKPAPSHHLYEIHTAPQGELITAVLSAEQIVELARLRDFL